MTLRMTSSDGPTANRLRRWSPRSSSPGSSTAAFTDRSVRRAFYRARAPEYDDWWNRRGGYDHGEAENLEWRRQIAVVVAALDSFDARGDVLELAGGTGWWTQSLARTADHLTVIDASAETL